MNPTNLTDEGLTGLARQTRRDWRKWLDAQPMAPKDVDRGIMRPWMYASDEYELDKRITTILQQVRDAAKKEEREACAKVAEKQEKGFWLGHKVLPDVPTLTIIATAIRRME